MFRLPLPVKISDLHDQQIHADNPPTMNGKARFLTLQERARTEFIAKLVSELAEKSGKHVKAISRQKNDEMAVEVRQARL